MSFNSNPSRVEYVVNTKTTTFTFNFKIFEPENLVVYKIPSGTLPDDETNKLLLNVDYTISINGDLGGFITLLNTPTIHDIIIIQRTLSIDRVTDFVNNGGIYSDVLNNDQDYQTYLIGDNEIENARHLKLPVTAVGVSSTIPAPIPNRYMLWNSQGTALINDENAPAWLTDAKGWAINPQNELFTDSTGTIDYSSKHYALYTSGRLDTVQTNGETFESNIDLLSTLDVQISNVGNHIDALITTSDNILDIISATKKATEASDSADYSELRRWESESFRLTAESYAVEPENIYVKIYTSNGDGTFTVTDTTDYSALHWEKKASELVISGIIDDTVPSLNRSYSSNKINSELSKINSELSKINSELQTELQTIEGELQTELQTIEGDISNLDSNKLNKSGGIMTGAITAVRETKVAMYTDNINLATGNLFTKTITVNTTLTISNVLPSGNANSFILELTNGGSKVITWWSGMKWAGGTIPTLTASGVDILGFYSHDGGTTWRGMVMAKDSK